MTDARHETILRHVRQLVLPAHTHGLSDAQLLERFRATRDEAAFSALMQRHGSLVWGVCRQVLGHTQDAEDAFQAAFLALARNASAIRKSQAVASWLHGTAYRAALRAKRDAARRRLHEGRAKPASAQPGSCEAAWRELQSALDEEVQGLPQRQRAVFVLCVLEGKSQAEAAITLGWKDGTISGTLARARQLLRARLARRGIELPALLAGLSLTAAPATAAPALTAATLRVALGDAAVPPQVAALLKGVTNAMLSTKRKALTALLLALALTTAALAWRAAPPTASTGAARPSGKPKVGLDAHGDPLPLGAVGRLGTLSFRHAADVSAFALSADGKTLASAGGGAIVLWDAATGKELRRFGGQTGGVRSLAFTRDGKFIASGAEDNIIRLWDVQKGQERRRFLGHQGGAPGIGSGVCRLVFSPDGKTLVSRGADDTIRVWQTATGKEVRRIKGVAGSVYALALSPDGKIIAAGGYPEDNGGVVKADVHVWETATGKEIRRLPHPGPTHWLAFSPDGKTLACGPGAIVVWEVGTWRKARTLGRDDGVIFAFDFSPDGKTLAVGTHEETYLLDTETGKKRAQIKGMVAALTFSPDGKTLLMQTANAFDHHAVRFWDLAARQEVRRLAGHQGYVAAIAFSADGKTLASGSGDGTVGVWDVASRTERHRLGSYQSGAFAVEFSPTGGTLFSGGWNGKFHSWDARTGKVRSGFDTNRGGSLLAIAPGGRMVASWEGNVEKGATAIGLWDSSGKERRRLAPAQGEVNTLAFSPDGRLLAAGSGHLSPGQFPHLMIWDVPTGRLQHQLSREKWALSLAFSPDGRTLASGHNDNKVRIWEVATGGLRLAFDHGDRPAVLAFSPDGGLLVSASNQNPRCDVRTKDDEKVRLWDPFTGARLRTLAGHRGAVASLAFSPDGRLLASGSNDTTILLWDATKLPRGAPPRPAAVARKELEACWADLNRADAAKAYLSMRKLLAAPGPTVALLDQRLRPVALEPKVATKLLAELDSAAFAIREKASQELARLGPVAEPALRRALARRPPLETHRRIEKLLRALDEGQYLGVLRGLEVLERLNTAEARKLLSALAGGEKEARVTREAKEALVRLSRRAPS